jgi:hypothetical protein
VSRDLDHADLDSSKLYIGSVKKALIDFPELLTANANMAIRHQYVIRELARQFLKDNKKFRYVKNHYAVVNEPLTLMVENYSYLHKFYEYTEMAYTPYYRWWNIQKTVWNKVEEISSKVLKNHVFFIDVPENLPSFNILELCLTKKPINILTILNTPEQLFILELWKWIGGTDRASTIFGGLSEKTFSQITIVFNTKDGSSVPLNLGYLNSWIKGNDNVTELSSVTQLPAINVKKVFLKFLITLNSVTDQVPPLEPTSDVPITDSDKDDLEEQKDLEEEANEYRADHEEDGQDDIDHHEYEDNLINGISKKDNKALTKALKEPTSDLTKSLSDSDFNLDRELANIDSDLKVLEKLSLKNLKQKGILIDASGDIIEEDILEEEVPLQVVEDKIFKFEKPEDGLKRQVSEQADYGLLSASDYKKLMNDIEAASMASDPYGSGKSIKEAMIINPSDLHLDKVKTTMTVSDLVQDKTMADSSLLSFNSDYVNNVLKKDILSMLNVIQKSGVLIKRHEIEEVHSVLGTYENHTLELKPIDGQVSTVRFKLPKISDDGSFLINGNKVLISAQRVDAPIRKINPFTVGLTSSYGKTFVTLNPKKANSSLEWLIKQLNIASMEDHPYIKRVAPANVFDNNFKAPYIYNALADNFKTIITSRYLLSFSHPERDQFTNGMSLSSLEVNDSRVVGQTLKKEPIVVDKDNSFFKVTPDGERHILGDIFDVLELDEQKAPVDFTEVRIFSKNIPVGVLLGYTVGFKNLLRLLKVNYRTTEGKRNRNIEKHEFAITFRDQSFIFSKKNRLATMVLAGFLEFEKQLKQYDLKEFNHKDVYLNLLESKGLGSVYMREIELTQQLFVDSITKGILEEQGNPTTFNGLLIKATEMLQDYHHPDSQDFKAQRVRGYERIPSAIYKELTTSIRQYRNRNISGKSKIDMSPYQIWSTITKDPALKLVEDINPIQNLKQSELITYVGEGGRGKDSMNKSSRAYHVNDMGVVSEATVDSGDVGINAYMSANPKFANLRGMPDFNSSKMTPANMVSTSALLAPGSDHDDQIRSM